MQRLAFGIARQVFGRVAEHDQRLLDMAARARVYLEGVAVGLGENVGLYALVACDLGDQHGVVGCEQQVARRRFHELDPAKARNIVLDIGQHIIGQVELAVALQGSQLHLRLSDLPRRRSRAKGA